MLVRERSCQNNAASAPSWGPKYPKRKPRIANLIGEKQGGPSDMDLSTAIAKLMRHRQWGEASLRLLGTNNVELVGETRSTIETGERLFREAIMDAGDAHKTKH